MNTKNEVDTDADTRWSPVDEWRSGTVSVPLLLTTNGCDMISQIYGSMLRYRSRYMHAEVRQIGHTQWQPVGCRDRESREPRYW